MLSIHCKIALFFFISLFGLSAILKIRNGEHAHYVGLVVAYTWNREKQMFVALRKEFDMQRIRFLELKCFRFNGDLKQTTTATARGYGKTKDLIVRTIAQHVRFKTLHIS